MPTLRSAAILCGGASRRFGRDKAFTQVGGRTLLAHALAAVAPFGPTRVIAGDAERAERLRAAVPPGVIVVPDDTVGRGPLGGLATALRCAEPGYVAVLAVDLPLVTPAWFTHLLEAAPSGARAIAARTTGRWEPLAAIYHTDTFAAANDPHRPRALQHFLDDVGAAAVDPGAWLGTLANVNTPADLAALDLT